MLPPNLFVVVSLTNHDTRILFLISLFVSLPAMPTAGKPAGRAQGDKRLKNKNPALCGINSSINRIYPLIRDYYSGYCYLKTGISST